MSTECHQHVPTCADGCFQSLRAPSTMRVAAGTLRRQRAPFGVSLGQSALEPGMIIACGMRSCNTAAPDRLDGVTRLCSAPLLVVHLIVCLSTTASGLLSLLHCSQHSGLKPVATAAWRTGLLVSSLASISAPSGMQQLAGISVVTKNTLRRMQTHRHSSAADCSHSHAAACIPEPPWLATNPRGSPNDLSIP
jgi:hypothetical protein